ncbi:GlxA family transcriptional regulator [Actinomadura gamaensis]|uniref:GlxA family transcriptional regulator n=1 Tax=Actinomadura gamaensis TaxID=1763541 RepID=A0ABV9U5Y6_9ACTN
MHHVAVLALDGVIPFELGIPARIFGAARDASGAPLYSVATCSLDGLPVRADADFTITVQHDASLLASADTVVIPPSHALEGIRQGAPLPDAVRDALGTVRPGTRMVAICTGAFVLAAAGLLDRRPATTHWRESDRLRRLFTGVRVDPDVLFVDDGDVLTSAGATAGIDLCLHLVRRDHGSEVAGDVARACVTPPWRDGGQAQYIRRPVPEERAGGLSATRAWALERLGEPLTLTEMAAHAGLSVRTFTRNFRAETGVSPGQWLAGQRIDLARHLLEATDLPVDAVARRAGFGTGTALRQRFRAALGVSPQNYRRTFRPVAA